MNFSEGGNDSEQKGKLKMPSQWRWRSRVFRPSPRRSRSAPSCRSPGKESKIGGAYKQATELAVKEVNDAGGLDVGGQKRKINLVLLDDTSDGAKSAQLVEQLCAQEKVRRRDRRVRLAARPGAERRAGRYGIPYISGGAGARGIYGRSKWVFGTLSPVDVLSQTQMDFLSTLVAGGKLKKPLKIALVTENTEHGKDYAQGVKDYIKAHPGDVLDRRSRRASSSTRRTSSPC